VNLSSRGTHLISRAFALGIALSSSMPGQAVSNGPILYRIVLPRATVCVGDRQLEVESELRNIGLHPVSLSPAGIRAQVSFANRPCSLKDGFRSNNISSDPNPAWKGGSIVTLAPGESYRKALKLELDPDFFPEGVYRVQIGYSGRYGAVGRAGLFVGMLDSNEVLFEVEDCSDSPAQKH